MKKINFRFFGYIAFACLALIMSVAPLASAVDPEPTDPQQTRRIENLIARADTEINRRLTALNNLSAKISQLKRVSDGQKSAFTSEIQSNITNLTNLKTKIDAATDPVVLRQDVKSIVDDYRIFALYIPKIHLLAGADIATETAGSLGSLAIKLQNKINTDKEAGKDIAKLQTLLTDMQTKIANASNQAANLTDSVIQLVPSGYPGNSNSLASARDMLKAARSDLQSAKQSAQQIITGLKALQTTKAANG